MFPCDISWRWNKKYWKQKHLTLDKIAIILHQKEKWNEILTIHWISINWKMWIY